MEDTEPSQLLLNRITLLRELDGEPQDTDELCAVLAVSESTIKRAVYDLEAVGYIEQCEEGYLTTLTGRLALTVYDRFERRMACIQEAIELLSVLDADAPLVPAVVSDAEIVHATDDRSHSARIKRLLDGARCVRSAPSTMSEQYLDLLYERTMDGTELSLVLSSSLVERLIADQNDRLAEILSSDQIALGQSDTAPPFGVTIVESDEKSVVELRIYGSDGVHGSIINDTPEAIAWAMDYYEEMWYESLPIHTID
ncbi:helix-turn-helix transcriptional regulator [Halocatena pleomorpha]|uniref:ArsR family transcriptional regulator n=1 Tax=Halocatena pleomorpha TaxID=1785090 RepID=A0A3P3RIQ3_9EURY|nr:hypothetical protein [Halocatena pleomorpha]RRJ33416.1 hypothetical protein EIK79_01000 [Halocatena pleomorpha]